MSRWGIFLPVAALVCAIDQASKWWIVKHMTLESVITVVPGFFDIVSVRNRGAAFGFLNRSDIDWQFWLFLGATLAAAACILSLVNGTFGDIVTNLISSLVGSGLMFWIANNIKQQAGK